MVAATTVGWVMKTAWLADTSVTFAPMRSAMWCSISCAKALSSVAITAQLGLVRQAAFSSTVPKTSMLIGTWASRMKAASASLTSWAKPAWKLSGATKP